MASRAATQRRIARATELLTALTVTARSSAEALIASARAASARTAALSGKPPSGKREKASWSGVVAKRK